MPELRDIRIDKIALVNRPATGEEFAIIKQDSGPQPGQSEKDWIWTQALAAFNVWREKLEDNAEAGTWQNGVKTDEYTGKSREQFLADWLTTSEGIKWYDKYNAASNQVTPVAKSDKTPEPQTLRELADQKFEAIAKAVQAKNPALTYEAAYAKAMTDSREFGEIYSLIHDSGPLANLRFTTQVSKSKGDAIQIFKSRIIVAAHRAGV